MNYSRYLKYLIKSDSLLSGRLFSAYYILATHNANIPVFGDAEQIITMEEEEGNGRIAIDGLGSIDDQGVKEKVIGILEGGPDAFRMREEKYGI